MVYIPVNETTIYYSRTKIDLVVTSIVTCLFFAPFILPHYILWAFSATAYTYKDAITIAVLLIFSMDFGAVMSLATKVKRYEILGVVAA